MTTETNEQALARINKKLAVAQALGRLEGAAIGVAMILRYFTPDDKERVLLADNLDAAVKALKVAEAAEKENA